MKCRDKEIQTNHSQTLNNLEIHNSHNWWGQINKENTLDNNNNNRITIKAEINHKINIWITNKISFGSKKENIIKINRVSKAKEVKMIYGCKRI